MAEKEPRMENIRRLADNRERNIIMRKEGYEYLIVEVLYKAGLKFGLGIKNVGRSIFVFKVEENSIVSNLFKPADRILDIDGEPIADNATCKAVIVRALKENKRATVLVERGVTEIARKEATDEMNEQHTQSVMAPPDVRSILKRLEHKIHNGALVPHESALTKKGSGTSCAHQKRANVEDTHKSVMIQMDNEQNRDRLKKVREDPPVST